MDYDRLNCLNFFRVISFLSGAYYELLFRQDHLFYYLFSFRRYFGVEIGHLQMAIYIARREEMIEVVRTTLFYMNPDEPVPVHSLSATTPYQVFYFVVNVLATESDLL